MSDIDAGTFVISTDFIRPVGGGMGLRLIGASSGYVGIKPADAAGSTDFTLPAADGSNGQAIVTNGSGVLSFASVGVTDHGALSGLSDDDHPQYFLQGGRFGGQLIYGGTAASNNLFVQSTSNATKGYVLLENFAEFRTTDVRFRGSTSGYVGLKSPAVGDNTIYRLPTTDGTSGQVMRTDGNGNLSFVTPSAGVTDHGALTGLSDDDHTQYVMLAGRAGGQILYGGTAASDDLLIASTSNATKGLITFNDSTMLVVDKANNQVTTEATPINGRGIVNRDYMRANNLTIGTAQTANFTATVGTLSPVTLTSATSDRQVTFPVSPTTGEKFGFFVGAAHASGGSSTNFTNRPFFCVEPANGTSINGSSYSAVAGEGSGKYGLWLTGEMMIFQYTGSTWLLVQDGRIPHVCKATRSTTQSIANSTVVQVSLDGEETDNAAMHDGAGDVEIKRSGIYSAFFNAGWAAASNGAKVHTFTRSVGSEIARYTYDPGGSSFCDASLLGIVDIAATVLIKANVAQFTGSSQNLSSGANVTVQEILT